MRSEDDIHTAQKSPKIASPLPISWLLLAGALMLNLIASLFASQWRVSTDVYVGGTLWYVVFIGGALWIWAYARRGRVLAARLIYLFVLTLFSLVGFMLAVLFAGGYPAPGYLLAVNILVLLSMLLAWGDTLVSVWRENL